MSRRMYNRTKKTEWFSGEMFSTDVPLSLTDGYGVVFKKLFHKSQGKMHWKMKMTWQRAENLVIEKQHYRNYFSNKRSFIFGLIQLIWSFESLILTILTITKYVQNLHRDSTLWVFSIAKIIFSYLDNAEKCQMKTF